MNDLECLENLKKNIEVERVRLGLTQSQMADAIGMSLSSYKRMLAGEMNLRASLVIRNLYYLTGKCCWEFMEIESPDLNLSKKIRNLSSEQIEVVSKLVDLLIRE